MRQHSGKFILPVDQGQQSTRHVDATPGDGKRIGLGLVHDLELNFHRGSFATAPTDGRISRRYASVSGAGVQPDLLLDQFGDFRTLLDVALHGRTQQLTLGGGEEQAARQKVRRPG